MVLNYSFERKNKDSYTVGIKYNGLEFVGKAKTREYALIEAFEKVIAYLID